MLSRDEFMDKVQDIHDANYHKFKGVNEAEPHTREEIADLVFNVMSPHEGMDDVEYKMLVIKGITAMVVGFLLGLIF